MKNKKIIPITICLVTAVLVGILGLSKFFETSWQQENTVDNSLNAEIIDNTETVFDYPYFNIKEHENLTDKQLLEIYSSEINTYKLEIQEGMQSMTMRSYDTEPSSEMVNYQDVANICGEKLKYLYGITNHSNIPACISFYQLLNIDFRYLYCIIIDDNYIFMTVNPYNGEIISISTSGVLVIEPDENIKPDRKTNYLTDDVKFALMKQIENDLEIIGIENEIEKIDFYDVSSDNGNYKFMVNIFGTDYDEVSMSYGTVDFNYYELWNYSIRYNQ